MILDVWAYKKITCQYVSIILVIRLRSMHIQLQLNMFFLGKSNTDEWKLTAIGLFWMSLLNNVKEHFSTEGTANTVALLLPNSQHFKNIICYFTLQNKQYYISCIMKSNLISIQTAQTNNIVLHVVSLLLHCKGASTGWDTPEMLQSNFSSLPIFKKRVQQRGNKF